jgi:polar amino acid transport system permease protein
MSDRTDGHPPAQIAAMSFFELLWASLPLFLRAMRLTLELSIVSLVIAMFIGPASCLMNISQVRVLR